ncbi:MAG: transporter [Cytophagaceae bacterium]|nr:transporter [Cytophagaceae bacterium]
MRSIIHRISVLGALVASSLVSAQELETLIEVALANNPEIQQFEVQYQRVSEKVNEVNTLPNTDFGLGYFVSEPETRTGAQRFKVSAKQMLPWFGTITSRANYANAMAEATFVDIVIAKRKLVASVSSAYYDLYANKEKQALLDDNLTLLQTYEQLALTSVEVGKASAVDVLRLQMRQNEMQQLKAILQEEYKATAIKLNNLLNRQKEASITLVTNLELPTKALEVTTQNLDFHPELLKYEKLYASVEQSELLHQKENKPMIGFGVDYINVSERPNMTFTDNGKDIIMPMAAISIPIFNSKNKAVSKQNDLRQQEILFQKQQRRNHLETLLATAVSKLHSARIRHESQTQNLKQAKDAEQILLKSYETGTIDFTDVLAIQELQLNIEMNRIAAIENYYLQMTIINYLTARS